METIAQVYYKVNEPIKAEDLSNVFNTSGINRPTDDLKRL